MWITVCLWVQYQWVHTACAMAFRSSAWFCTVHSVRLLPWFRSCAQWGPDTRVDIFFIKFLLIYFYLNFEKRKKKVFIPNIVSETLFLFVFCSFQTSCRHHCRGEGQLSHIAEKTVGWPFHLVPQARVHLLDRALLWRLLQFWRLQLCWHLLTEACTAGMLTGTGAESHSLNTYKLNYRIWLRRLKWCPSWVTSSRRSHVSLE